MYFAIGVSFLVSKSSLTYCNNLKYGFSHEKHGIPVDLIALLDFAVEIPQFGMVRSLNVHVTGSLFIWEYCKQHISKK